MAFLQRARNEGGTNSLRGGKKAFGPKTKCGNWVEKNAEPGLAQPPGFPHALYQTVAHSAMYNGLLRRPKRYGAALPPEEDPSINAYKVMNYDKSQNDKGWATINSTNFKPPGSKEKARNITQTPDFYTSMCRQYNARTTETNALRGVRFKTNAVISANSGVTEAFKSTQTRVLPGTPIAVESLRVAIMRNGKVGLGGVRRALRMMDESGDGRLQPYELKRGLCNLGVRVNDVNMEKVVKFFDRDGDGVISLREFLRGLQGPMSDRRYSLVKKAFQALDISGDGQITIKDLKQLYHVERHPDVLAGRATEEEAYRRFLSQWDMHQRDDQVSLEEFEDYFGDISASVETDDQFAEMFASAWGIDEST